MEQNVKCTRPHCKCVEIAEEKNGGEPVKSYPCLASIDHSANLNELKRDFTMSDLNEKYNNLLKKLK